MYIEGYDQSGDFGRVHYASQPSGGADWTAAAVTDAAGGAYTYTRSPALAIRSGGQPLMVHPGHASNPACPSPDDVCLKARNPDGTWGASTLLVAHGGAFPSLDVRASVKWGVIGLNRPDTLEMLFFAPVNGDENQTVLLYARA